MHRTFARLCAASATLALAGTAFAQVALTHDKALAGGVSPDDTPGYPILISQPGSYVLKSNLVVPLGQRGISITAPGVTLDLNGYSIIGAGSCSQDSSTRQVICTSTLEHGIWAGSTAAGVVLRNGGVQGFSTGIMADAPGATLEDLRVAHIGSTGILASNTTGHVTALRRSSVDLVGSTGVVMHQGSVEYTHVSRSGSYGIWGHASVSDSSARLCRDTGINYAVVRATVAELNGTDTYSVLSVGGNVRSGKVY